MTRCLILNYIYVPFLSTSMPNKFPGLSESGISEGNPCQGVASFQLFFIIVFRCFFTRFRDNLSLKTIYRHTNLSFFYNKHEFSLTRRGQKMITFARKIGSKNSLGGLILVHKARFILLKLYSISNVNIYLCVL